MYEQIYNIDITSHREHFQKHLSPRSSEVYRYGVSGPKACERHSSWRRFAFTRKDQYMSQVEGEKVNIIRILNGQDVAYVVSFMGNIRTVLTEPPKYYTGSVIKEYTGLIISNRFPKEEWLPTDTDFEICKLEEIEGNKWADINEPKTFALQSTSICNENITNDNCCRFIIGGNPTVNLDSRFVDFNNILQLDMPDLNLDQELVILNNETSLGSVFLLTVEIDDPVCSTFPDPIVNDFHKPDSNHLESTSPFHF